MAHIVVMDAGIGDTPACARRVITAGPRLGVDKVPGAGPLGGRTRSIRTVGHAGTLRAQHQEFLDDPGPLVCGGFSKGGRAGRVGMAFEKHFRRETTTGSADPICEPSLPTAPGVVAPVR